MSFIHENVAALFIAFVVCGFGWMYGGRDPEVVLRYMPWLTLFMLEVAICFPQRHPGETTSHARTRVWRAMKKDPLVWTALGFVALLCIPFLNTGLCPLCDRALIALGHDSKPPFGFLPFCVDRVRHLHVFMWFLPTLAAMVATRHCLTRYGKRTLLEMVVWNGLALAVLGFVQQISDAPGPLWRPFASKSHVYFFSTFGYPNMAGDYFTTLFGLAVGLWRWQLDESTRSPSMIKAPSSAPAVGAEAASGGDAEHSHHHHHHHGSSAPKKEGHFWQRHYYLIPAVRFFFCVNSLSKVPAKTPSYSSSARSTLFPARR